jgi:hypothetical protein
MKAVPSFVFGIALAGVNHGCLLRPNYLCSSAQPQLLLNRRVKAKD